MRTLAERCRAIELLVLDVDGVLTDGKITYHVAETTLGEEKRFHVRDGSGLVLWHRVGKQSAIITGRSSPIVDQRAKELGISQVIQGSRDKQSSLQRLLTHFELSLEQIAYVGDDLPDLEVLRQCGLAVTVADACSEVLSIAHYVTQVKGGCGAVREIIERILRCQELWPSK